MFCGLFYQIPGFDGRVLHGILIGMIVYGMFLCQRTQHIGREWALLVPSWTVVVVLLTYMSYSAIAIRATPAFHDMASVAGMYTTPNVLRAWLNKL